MGATKAIIAGLVAGHTTEKPGYLLHTRGTGILTWEDSDKNVYGTESEHVHNDWDGVDDLLGLPAHVFHRNVDQLVLDAGTQHAEVLKTALVCPPTIYHTNLPISTRRIKLLSPQQAKDNVRSTNIRASYTY